MLRALTAGLICLVFGMDAAQRLNRRVKSLRAWQMAMEKISTQCACLRLPPNEILQNALGTTTIEKDLLTREERRLVEDCLQAVLDGTQEEQERQLHYTMKSLSQSLTEAEDKQKQDAKLFGSLGLLGGLCVFLMCL